MMPQHCWFIDFFFIFIFGGVLVMCRENVQECGSLQFQNLIRICNKIQSLLKYANRIVCYLLAVEHVLGRRFTVLERVTSLLVAEYILYHLVFTQVKQRVEGVTWDFYIQPPAIAFLGEIVLVKYVIECGVYINKEERKKEERKVTFARAL